MIKNMENLNIAMLGQKVVPSRRGGIEEVLTRLCPLLVERGQDVTCFNRSSNKIADENLSLIHDGYYQGVQLRKTATLNKRGLAAMSASVTAALHAAIGSFDIIHFHAEGPCAAMWIPKLFGKHCIATVHGLDWQRDKWKNGIGSKYIKFGEKMLVKYADAIIVLSRGVQKYFMDRYNRQTVFIPNGVVRPVNRPAKLITEKFGLKKDGYYCALSRLTEEKGVHYLIKAYQDLHTDKKLVIAGDTSDTDDYVMRLKELAADNPNIIFTGFVSGELLDEIYSNAYVYILPSNLEGMPLSLLEAMSYGNAVIGSDIPEITDVMEDKGIIFEKGNIDDLQSKMQMLEDHPEKVMELKKESSEFICEKYNWDDIADATLQLYRNILHPNIKLVHAGENNR